MQLLKEENEEVNTKLVQASEQVTSLDNAVGIIKQYGEIIKYQKKKISLYSSINRVKS